MLCLIPPNPVPCFVPSLLVVVGRVGGVWPTRTDGPRVDCTEFNEATTVVKASQQPLFLRDQVSQKHTIARSHELTYLLHPRQVQRSNRLNCRLLMSSALMKMFCFPTPQDVVHRYVCMVWYHGYRFRVVVYCFTLFRSLLEVLKCVEEAKRGVSHVFFSEFRVVARVIIFCACALLLLSAGNKEEHRQDD